jgi:hypothetical protein
MVASRVGASDHPDVVQQRGLVWALKAEYDALPVAAEPVQVVAVVAAAQAGAPAPAAAVVPPPPPPPAAPAWTPTHLVPDEGMAAWAAPDPSLPPAVTLGGRLELVVAERAGDWARVVAVNGWTGWVDARRLVPRE